MNDCDTKHTFN